MNRHEQHIIGKMLNAHPRNMNVWMNVKAITIRIRIIHRGFDYLVHNTIRAMLSVLVDNIFSPHPLYKKLMEDKLVLRRRT